MIEVKADRNQGRVTMDAPPGQLVNEAMVCVDTMIQMFDKESEKLGCTFVMFTKMLLEQYESDHAAAMREMRDLYGKFELHTVHVQH